MFGSKLLRYFDDIPRTIGESVVMHLHLLVLIQLMSLLSEILIFFFLNLRSSYCYYFRPTLPNCSCWILDKHHRIRSPVGYQVGLGLDNRENRHGIMGSDLHINFTSIITKMLGINNHIYALNNSTIKSLSQTLTPLSCYFQQQGASSVQY